MVFCMIKMNPRYFATATIVVVLSAWLAYNYAAYSPSGDHVSAFNTVGNNNKVLQYEAVPIDGAVGPESFAFDSLGDGPYTGVSDGRIIKWDRHQNRWLDFAVSSSQRDECGGAPDGHGKSEHICGRPLGLCFSQTTADLYIADAYMGLLVVGPTGGNASIITRQGVDDAPLNFANSLDIDQRTGLIYFTASSSIYQRRDYISLILSGDNTGKLMKYDPQSKQLSVLLNNLSFANGVLLSKDGDYLLIAETTNCRILKYWLQTQKSGTLEVFVELPGFPDNIKPSPRGGFWVGIHSRREKFIQWILSYSWIGKSLVKIPYLDINKIYSYLAKLKGSTGLAIRLSEEGDVLEIIEGRSGNRGRSISEVEERDGTLWVGSVDGPFAFKYNALDA